MFGFDTTDFIIRRIVAQETVPIIVVDREEGPEGDPTMLHNSSASSLEDIVSP